MASNETMAKTLQRGEAVVYSAGWCGRRSGGSRIVELVGTIWDGVAGGAGFGGAECVSAASSGRRMRCIIRIFFGDD